MPNKSTKEQYEFAVSFIKVGDYETAEFALREFIDKNKDNELAGSAQYWYGETFRVRQLYQDAAAAYLDGYQNYPKSKKAPINLLKLGSTLVKMGEKEQGCLMILGVKKEYPKASQSVLQKLSMKKKSSSVQKFKDNLLKEKKILKNYLKLKQKSLDIKRIYLIQLQYLEVQIVWLF